MRTLRPILLGLLLLALPLCLLIAGGWWWLNSYVKTDDFRHDMEARLSRTLQGPVTIQKVSFDFFHGVELKGLAYQYTSAPLSGNAQVTVSQVDCGYSWRALFHGKMDLTKLALHQPNLLLRQLPAPTPPVSENNPIPAALTPPVETTASPTPPTPPASSSDNLPLAFQLRRLQVVDGTVTLQDETNAPVLSLQKIQAEADTRKLAQDQITGTLYLGEIDLPSQLKITDFSTPYSYQHGAIQAKPFTAALFGGNLVGDYDLSPPIPSTLDINVKGCDLAQIAAAMAPHLQLTGSLDLQSKWRALETGHQDGEGDLQIENGQLGGIPLLQQISDLLKIKELAAPTFTEAQSHFTVAGLQLRLTSLDVEGDVFSLTGDGTITLTGDRPIDFNLVLMLRREAMEEMPKLAASSFIKKEDGTGSISFRLNGTLKNPQTDLPTRLLSQNTELQNVISNALESFFHKHEPKPQPAASSAPPATVPALTNTPPSVAIPAVTNAPPAMPPPSTNSTPDVPKSATTN